MRLLQWLKNVDKDDAAGAARMSVQVPPAREVVRLGAELSRNARSSREENGWHETIPTNSPTPTAIVISNSRGGEPGAATLRRAECSSVTVEHVQQREGRWLIADLVGKGGRC